MSTSNCDNDLTHHAAAKQQKLQPEHYYGHPVIYCFLIWVNTVPVHCDEEAVVVPRARDDPDLVEEEGADAGCGRAQGGVDDGGGDRDAVAVAGDGALLGPVAGEEAKHQDQAAQGRQGHRVAGHRNLEKKGFIVFLALESSRKSKDQKKPCGKVE